MTARESDTGANDASRLRSGKAPSHGAAITVDGTAARGSTLSRAHAKSPAAGNLDPALMPAAYGLRIIPVGLAGKDGLAVKIVPKGPLLSDQVCVRFFQGAVALGSLPS